MRAFAITLIPLFAGFLFAQNQSRTETRTTTTKTTWDGTLVDAACQTSHTVHRESSRVNNSDESVTTRKETAHTETADCPVTTETKTFGVLTSNGRFIRFDDPSNTKTVEIIRSNKDFSGHFSDHAPMKVKVVGSANGDVAFVDSLDPANSTAVLGEAVGHDQAEALFDVRNKDDRGKLVVTAKGVSFDDLSNEKRSHTWNYAEIRELTRNGSEVKIQPYSGDQYEFHVEGKAMSDTIYKVIGDRIVAAHGH